ncbi:MAG: FAD-dependent oxidoreductase [Coriobacteriia bacterium]|nr:FAD-dependent oxidoreductase [Coriobacteriia bacterium]
MPPLHRPERALEVSLPARSATLARECDVLVVGGGPAGLGAALGAAEAGARTVLTERYGFLGGWATAALVMPLASYHTSELRPTRPGSSALFPTDTGPGEPVIRGALEAFVGRLVDAGGAIPPSPRTGWVVPFDAEVFKLVALEMCDEAGVEFLLHALATVVQPAPAGETGEPGRGPGRSSAGAWDVIFETKSGPLAVRAKSVVDCTGDGDVAAAAGASYEIGRTDDGLTQPATLIFQLAGFDHASFTDYVAQNPGQWFGVYGLWDLIYDAFQAGEYKAPREDILLFASVRDGEVTVNATRVPRVNGADAFDLTRAEIEGRRQMREVAAFLRAHVPGFEETWVVTSGAQVGIRETRRVVGEYRLTAEDVLGARRFEDVVARNAYPMDIHNPEGRGTVLRKLPPGQAYDIPLRSLIPLGIDGVLVAGRCISATHEALSSARVMPACMATGQAAGVCAALSARAGAAPRSIDAGDVQAELLRQGADLGERGGPHGVPGAAEAQAGGTGRVS